MIRFFKQHGLTLAYAILIFVVSSIPSLKPPLLGFRFGDKLIHMGEYGVFGFLLMRSGYFLSIPSGYTALTGIFYGGLDEMHQRWVPGRHADGLDFLADAVGVMLGIWVYAAVKRQKRVIKISHDSFKNFTFFY